MSGRRKWDLHDDMFIHAYAESVGFLIGPRDLGRSAKAVRDRTKTLKESGAWDALSRMWAAERDYYKALGADEMDADIATVRRVP